MADNPKLSKEYCVTPYRDERGRFVKRPETEAKVKQTKRASAPTPPPPPPAPPKPKVFKRTTKKVVKKGVLKRGQKPVDYLVKPYLDDLLTKPRFKSITQDRYDYIKTVAFTNFVVNYIQNPTDEKTSFENWKVRIEPLIERYNDYRMFRSESDKITEYWKTRPTVITKKDEKRRADLGNDAYYVKKLFDEARTKGEQIYDLPRVLQRTGGRKISSRELERENLEKDIAYYNDLLDKFSRIKNGLIPTANYDKEFEQILEVYQNDIQGRLDYVTKEYKDIDPDRPLVQQRKKKVIKLRVKSQLKEQPFPPAGVSLEPKKTTFELRNVTGFDAEQPFLVIKNLEKEMKGNPSISLNGWIEGRGGLSQNAKLTAIATNFAILIVNDKITPKIRKVFEKAKSFRPSFWEESIRKMLDPGDTKPVQFVGFRNIDTEKPNPKKREAKKKPWVAAAPNGIFVFQDAEAKVYTVAVDIFCTFGWSDIATGAWSFRVTKEDKSPVYVYRGKTLIGIAAQLHV